MERTPMSKLSTCLALINIATNALIPFCERILDATLTKLPRDPCTCGRACYHRVGKANAKQSGLGRCSRCGLSPSSQGWQASCKACRARYNILASLHGASNGPALAHSNASRWLCDPIEVFRVFVSPSVTVTSLAKADASAVLNFLCFNKKVPSAVKKNAMKARTWRNESAHANLDEAGLIDVSAEQLRVDLDALLVSVAENESSLKDVIDAERQKLHEKLANDLAATQLNADLTFGRPRDMGARIVDSRVRQRQYVDASLHSLATTQSFCLGSERALMKLPFVDAMADHITDDSDTSGDVTDALLQRAQAEVHGVLLLSGEAGSGKSACVRAVAEQLFLHERSVFFVDLGALQGRLPARTEKTRDGRDEINALVDAFLGLVVAHLSDFMTRYYPHDGRAFEAFFWQQCRSPQSMFVFDSFDETPAIVSGERAKQQLQWFSEALESLAKQHLVIVASRRFHCPQGHLKWEIELKDPPENEQRAFVDARLSVMETMTSLREAISDTLFTNTRLQELRERPLLLSLTCDYIVRRFKSGERSVDKLLPDSSHLLLSDWCNVMLRSANLTELAEQGAGFDELLLVARASGMVAQTSGQQLWVFNVLEKCVCERLRACGHASAADVAYFALKALENCGVLVRVGTGAAMDSDEIDEEVQDERRVRFWHRRLLESFAAEYLMALPTSELPRDILENDSWEHVLAFLLDQCARADSKSPKQQRLFVWFLEQGSMRCRALVDERDGAFLTDESDKILCDRLTRALEGECEYERETLLPWKRVQLAATSAAESLRQTARRWYAPKRRHMELIPLHETDDGADMGDDGTVGESEGADAVEVDDEYQLCLWLEACNFTLCVFAGIGRSGVPEHARMAHVHLQRAALELAVCAARRGDWRSLDVLLNSAGVLPTFATEAVLGAALKNSAFFDSAIVKILDLGILCKPVFVSAIQWKIAECVRIPDMIESRPLLRPFMSTSWYKVIRAKHLEEQGYGDGDDDDLKRLRNRIARVDPSNVSPKIYGALELFDRHGKWALWLSRLAVLVVIIVLVWGIVVMQFGGGSEYFMIYCLLLFLLCVVGSQRLIVVALIFNVLVWFFYIFALIPTSLSNEFDLSSACNGTIKHWVYDTWQGCTGEPPAAHVTLARAWVDYDRSCSGGSTMNFQCCWFTEDGDIFTGTAASSVNSTIWCELESGFDAGTFISFVMSGLLIWITLVTAFWREFVRVLIRGPHAVLMRTAVVVSATLLNVLAFVAAVCVFSLANRIKSPHYRGARASLVILLGFAVVSVVTGIVFLAVCRTSFGLRVLVGPLGCVLGVSMALGVFACWLVVFVIPPTTLDRSTFARGGVFVRALWHERHRWLLFTMFTSVALLGFVSFKWLSASVARSLYSSEVHVNLILFAVSCSLLGTVVMLGSGALMGWLASLCGVETLRRKKTADERYETPLGRLELALQHPCVENAEQGVAEFLLRLPTVSMYLSGDEIARVRHWTVMYRMRSTTLERSMYALQKNLYRMAFNVEGE